MPFRRGETPFGSLKIGGVDIVARYVGDVQIWPEGAGHVANVTFAASAAIAGVSGSTDAVLDAAAEVTGISGTAGLSFTTQHGRNIAAVAFGASGSITGVIGVAPIALAPTAAVRVTGTATLSLVTEHGGRAFSSAYSSAYG